MPLKARNLVLTKSQAACLVALRHRQGSKTEIAILAKLDLLKTAAAVRVLMRLGLARQDRTKAWHATARGKTCRFATVPGRQRRNSGVPGPGARRLLEVLDRPMRGREIAEKLGVTHQRVHQLTIRLHAQGHVTFGDPENPLRIVMRTGDKTPFLSRDDERVLSAIPPEYATNAKMIRLVVRMPENEVQQSLDRLIASRFVEACEGFQGNQLYRITAAGLKHPQRSQSSRRAQAPRLPVESDRIRKVLSAILDSGVLRIKRHGCLRSAAPIDKCAHAVSQAKAFGEKNRSRVQRAVCVDGRRTCSLGGNDTTTCRVDSILPRGNGALA